MKNLLLIVFVLTSLLASAHSGKDFAQYGRYSMANSQLKHKPTVVFMGNSITDFWIGKDSIFFQKNNFVDRGISGQTTIEMLARFQQDVVNLSPTAVIILVGINDIAENLSYIKDENIMQNISSMAQIAVSNGIKVILCSILPCDRFQWNDKIMPAKRVKSVNKLIKEYAAKNGIEYVDYYTSMTNANGGLPAELSQDYCHPTLRGYLIMEKIAIKGISKTLSIPESKFYISR